MVWPEAFSTKLATKYSSRPEVVGVRGNHIRRPNPYQVLEKIAILWCLSVGPYREKWIVSPNDGWARCFVIGFSP